MRDMLRGLWVVAIANCQQNQTGRGCGGGREEREGAGNQQLNAIRWACQMHAGDMQYGRGGGRGCKGIDFRALTSAAWVLPMGAGTVRGGDSPCSAAGYTPSSVLPAAVQL